jgi:3-oxoacyl-[acyl-carrier protein] reductase
MQLKDKTAIITGSGRGLGKAIAFKLANSGSNIVLNDIQSSEVVDETYNEFKRLGFNVIVTKGDVRNSDDVQNMVNKAVEEFGTVDILVNNAGITKDRLIIKMTEEDWDSVLDINLKGSFNCTKMVSKVMMKKRTGVIINVASVVGIMGNIGQANYSASKAGLIGLTKSTAKELARRGIRGNAIAPEFIESKMTEILDEKTKEVYLNNIPLNRFGTPEEVANVIGFLASDDSKYITGQVINIDGGLVM